MRIAEQTISQIWLAFILLSLAACSAPMPSSTPSQMFKEEAGMSAPVPAKTEYSDKDFGRALAALKDGNLKQAEKLFLVVSQVHPELVSPHSNLGIIYYQGGRWEEALNAFQQAVKLDQQDYVAYNYLGIVQRNMGQFLDAKLAYEHALDIKPDYSYAHLNLAILYDLYLNELGQAMNHYSQYMTLTGGEDKRINGWMADMRQRTQNTSSGTDKERK